MSTRKEQSKSLVIRTTAGAKHRALELGDATRRAAIAQLEHAMAAQAAWINPYTIQISLRELAAKESENRALKAAEAKEAFENAMEACLRAIAADHATPENEVEVKTTMKVVLNKSWGGFGLSDRAKEALAKEIDKEITEELEFEIAKSQEWRSRPELVKVVENLGEEANGPHAKLAIVLIPADVAWYIRDHDGAETACEPHRTW